MIIELAKRRRTVREFRRDDFPVEKIVKAIEVAREAPSGINKQPWFFLIVGDRKRKKEIREVAEIYEKISFQRLRGELKEWLEKNGVTWEKKFLEDAPYLVMVFSDARAPYSKESTWVAVGYFLLALEEEELSTVTYTPPSPREIAKVVNAPKHYRLEVIMPVGYPKKETKKKERKGLNDIMAFEHF